MTTLDGFTPVMNAAIFNRMDVVNLLVDNGADLFTKN